MRVWHLDAGWEQEEGQGALRRRGWEKTQGRVSCQVGGGVSDFSGRGISQSLPRQG